MVLDGVGSIIGGISNMLMALSHIPGFGWAKDAANSMRGASDQAHALANGIKDIPDKKTIDITARFTSIADNMTRALAHSVGAKAVIHAAVGGPVGGIGTRDSEPYMLTPGEFIVRRDGSNIADALKHFGAKAVTPAADFDYDRMAAAMSRAQIVLDGKNVAAAVDQRLAPR